MENNIISIEEFAYPGKEGKKVIDLETRYGVIKLYHSKQMTDEMIQIVSKNKLLTPFKDKIIGALQKEIIYPVRYNKSYLSFLVTKVKVFMLNNLSVYANKYIEAACIAGFFTPEKNKIYLLIDNQTSILNNLREEDVAFLILHELSHYCAYNYKSAYFNATKNQIVGFYKGFYESMLEIKNCEKELLNYAKQVYVKCEQADNVSVKTPIKLINDYIKPLQNKSDIDLDDYNSRLKDWIMFPLFYILQYGYPGDSKFNRRYAFFHRTCIKAYLNYLRCPLDKIRYTLFYQEFFAPSEIPAIGSTNPNNSKSYMKLLKV